MDRFEYWVVVFLYHKYRELVSEMDSVPCKRIVQKHLSFTSGNEDFLEILKPLLEIN